ncbi:MAG: ribbon-helix-helix protein, CopG family [Actinomycetes bacterium]
MADLEEMVTIRLERWQADGLRLLAEREDLTVSQIIRKAVSQRVLDAISEQGR